MIVSSNCAELTLRIYGLRAICPVGVSALCSALMQKKIFGAPQGLGDEHYKMPEGFVKNILDRNTAKKAKEEAAAKKAPAAKKEQKEEPAAKSGGKAKGL